MKDQKSNILIITGLSGAGMSSSLKHLEDLGFEVFDNMPLTLVDKLLEDTKNNHPVAIGIDSRTRGFDPEKLVETVKNKQAQLVFLTCDDAILQKRFTETRRRHPMAKDRPPSAGIKREREILESLQKHTDFLIDSSGLSIHDLRRILEGYFKLNNSGKLTVTLMSFGFRYGLPREADIVMDVRFLKNPHWDQNLKPLTGLDKAVGEYIKQDENFESFLTHFKTLTEPLLPRYAHEGKSYLTIAIGCTGGRHRSVYSTEQLKPWLKKQGFTVHIEHRDINN